MEVIFRCVFFRYSGRVCCAKSCSCSERTDCTASINVICIRICIYTNIQMYDMSVCTVQNDDSIKNNKQRAKSKYAKWRKHSDIHAQAHIHACMLYNYTHITYTCIIGESTYRFRLLILIVCKLREIFKAIQTNYTHLYSTTHSALTQTHAASMHTQCE